MRRTVHCFRRSWLFFFLVTVCTVSACLGAEVTVAADESEPSPAVLPPLDQVGQMTIETGMTGHLRLVGSEARKQIVVTGQFAEGKLADLTRAVELQVDPAGIVAVDRTGMVTPMANGAARITAMAPNGHSATLEIEVSNWGNDPPVSFPNQVVPVFTKLTCNGGGCHGKSGGQNGFRLSLLGFEPSEDYEFLTREARGRRLSPAAPEHSLLLLKASGTLPHGGGARMENGDPNYRVLKRWIAEGADFGDPEVAKVATVEVFPTERMMEQNAEQQLVVIAHYTDGRSEDVSRMAKYEVNVTDMADVSETGLVRTADQAGDVAVMIRYQSQVAVFRATIPLGAPIESLPPQKNFIDQNVFAKLTLLGMPPSEICDDSTFVRRVTIDITGRLPDTAEVDAFLADSSPDKRDRYIDELLASNSYADYFANKWTAILRNKRQNGDYKRGTFAFHDWIRQALIDNMPYDEFVRSIVAASGEVGQNPPVVWYREVNEINEQVEDTAQLFLGMRIQCARCHHHPFEKWSRHDYYSFAAFFSRVGRKGGDQPSESRIFHKFGKANARNPKNNQTVIPAGLGAAPKAIPNYEDPRQQLVDWMSQPDNPFFARMLVNRYWKHFFDRGLVDPEDDMRATNPPSNPELLDALAKSFVDSGFDMKQLVRDICRSTTYQLSSEPNQYNIGDKQNFSRYYPRRLNAEVLLDAIDQVTGAVTSFGEVPVGTKAVQLPDSGFNNYFLKVFGRPESASACECERSTDANLAQSLHLINSADIQGKISADVGRAAQLAGEEQRQRAEKFRELYLVALAREPMSDEVSALEAYLDKKAAEEKPNVRHAYEDIVWTLLNTKEFLFNH